MKKPSTDLNVFLKNNELEEKLNNATHKNKEQFINNPQYQFAQARLYKAIIYQEIPMEIRKEYHCGPHIREIEDACKEKLITYLESLGGFEELLKHKDPDNKTLIHCTHEHKHIFRLHDRFHNISYHLGYTLNYADQEEEDPRSSNIYDELEKHLEEQKEGAQCKLKEATQEDQKKY